MTRPPASFASGSRRDSAVFALLVCLLIFVIGLALPLPLAGALVAVGVGLAPFALRLALAQPVILCIGFVIFSFFRIHEVFPVLGPLRIPQLLAIPTLGVLAWHMLGSRSLAPFMTRELKVLL